jgi:hypothetical protein
VTQSVSKWSSCDHRRGRFAGVLRPAGDRPDLGASDSPGQPGTESIKLWSSLARHSAPRRLPGGGPAHRTRVSGRRVPRCGLGVSLERAGGCPCLTRHIRPPTLITRVRIPSGLLTPEIPVLAAGRGFIHSAPAGCSAPGGLRRLGNLDAAQDLRELVGAGDHRRRMQATWLTGHTLYRTRDRDRGHNPT